MLLVVDDDADTLANIARQLRDRYGGDYRVVCKGSAEAAIGALGEGEAAGEDVAVVLSDQWMPGMSGTEFLTRARRLYPTAKRALLVAREDGSVREPILRAMALGRIDYYVAKPSPQAPDEQFHRVIAEFLDEWTQAHRPGFVAIRIVGEPGSPRSHELRERWSRSRVPLEFRPADSEEGQGLLARWDKAQAMKGEEVYVVGGGNSAGQAAMYLSKYASRVTLLVRGASLAASLSDYLIEQLGAAENVEVRLNTRITDGGGEGRLERLVLEDSLSGLTETVPAAALFVLIGARPRTEWLPREIERDEKGFVATDRDLLPGSDGGQATRPYSGWPIERSPLPLETSLSGVFAAGDARQRSMKRVAPAVGEGSVAISSVREYLNFGF